jgi:hypothetical protein
MTVPRCIRVLAAPFLLLVAIAGGREELQAQLTPADSAAVLLEAAQYFDALGREEVARALFELIATRFPSTLAGGVAAGRVATLRVGDQTMSRGGRVELQVWSTLYGLFLGVAIPAALDSDDPEAYGVGLLLGGPAGFLAGRRLASGRELSDGQTRAITFGGTWGTWQGFGWAQVADANDSPEVFASMIAGGLVGIGTGAVLSRRPISAAAATASSLGALWGTWFALAGGVLADVEGDDLLALSLLGGNAGLAGAALASPSWGMSRNRLRLVSIAGVMGGLGGAGLDLIIQPESEKIAIAIPLAGSLIGLGLGVRFTRDRDQPVGGGALTDARVEALLGEGALLMRDGGRFSLGSPLPTPTLLPLDRGGWEPGLALNLFRASFH